jgi:hypothetical protein
VPNNSFNNSSLDIPLLRAQDPYNTRNDRSVAATNAPHIINLSGLYDLPFGTGKRWASGGGWKDHVVGGWNINGLARFRSGFPLAVPMGIGNAFDLGTPGGSQRPDRIAGVPLINPDWTRENAWRGVPYINPRAFAVPEPGRLGNAPRNLDAYYPWVNTIDMSVFKRFTPFENRRRYFELRAEVFNVLNLKQYTPNPNITGLLTGANQNPLTTGTSPNFTAVPNVQNRFGNLRAPGVWDAVIAKFNGTPVDNAIAGLPGPGPGGVGCPANAPELGAANQTGALSPACVARSLNIQGGFGRMNANTVQPRIVQFALKFYF